MRKLGRCGRRRKLNRKYKISQGVLQAHLPEYTRLHQWMKSIMGKICWKHEFRHTLTPAQFEETGRGLAASRRICAGDTIVSIPLQLLITTTTVFDSHIGSVISKQKNRFTPQQLLTIFLVIERSRGETSQWFPYVNSLPQEYSTPLYLSSRELKLLTPRVRRLAVSAKKRFSVAFDKIKAFVTESVPLYEDLFSELDVRWAWSTVNTRSVYLETASHPLLLLDPEESNVALAPFLDLLNHSDSAQMSAGINTRTNCYEILTQDTYKKNEQVFICYGPHDNIKLFINYGFTLPHNHNSAFTFSLDDVRACIQDHTDIVERKLGIIKETHLDRNLVCTLEGISWSLSTALKIAALCWENLLLWKLLIQGEILSQDIENLATQMALKLIRSALEKAKKHLEFVEMYDFDIARSLAQDDVDILEHSLSLLEER